MSRRGSVTALGSSPQAASHLPTLETPSMSRTLGAPSVPHISVLQCGQRSGGSLKSLRLFHSLNVCGALMSILT